jgi:hypothetical protein
MFDWTFLDETGQEIGRSPRFPEPDVAEEWIGGCWTDLVENGIEAVVLTDHGRGRQVYRMGLGPGLGED